MQQGSYPIGSRTINVNTDNATGVVTGATCDIPLNLLAQVIQTYLGLQTPIAIASGGTGATTATAARANLGLGSMAVQDASNVSINGGTINNTAINGTSVTSATAIPVSSGGTGANTFTAHGVLIGEGTGAIVASSTGTSGQPLLSGGASADPAYGNLGVGAGGTGRTTLTARSVLIGEGTSAVNFATPSTAGQALISTGASSDPVFGAPTGTLINIQRITSTQTYTPTTGTNSIIVRICGGGGGGGGCAATAVGSNGAVAGGGGSGSYAESRITSGFSGVTVTIGAGGGGGAAGANAGSSGGTSSFGALISCPGGNGGPGGATSSPPFLTGRPTPSSVSTGGNIVNTPGSGAAAPGFYMSNVDVQAGEGGASMFGPGPLGALPVSGGTAAGLNAVSLGAGGSGAASNNGGAASAGGNGAAGLCIIYEYA